MCIRDRAEGAGLRDFAGIALRVEVEDLALAADHDAVEIDLDIEAEAMLGRSELGEGAALLDADRLKNLEICLLYTSRCV